MTLSYDPTDHHPARPVYPTAEALRDARMQRGICSDADCSWPIDGWCVTCRAKLCERHLHDHHNQHSREYLAQHPLEAHVRDDAGAGVLAPVDVTSGVCDECGLEVTESYCPDCGMWVCDDCWHAHESGDVDFDDEDELDDSEEA